MNSRVIKTALTFLPSPLYILVMAQAFKAAGMWPVAGGVIATLAFCMFAFIYMVDVWD